MGTIGNYCGKNKILKNPGILKNVVKTHKSIQPGNTVWHLFGVTIGEIKVILLGSQKTD